MHFLCIYLDEGRGVCTHVYIYFGAHNIYFGTHNQPFLQNHLWMFTKLDRDEVLIVTHLCIGFSANSTQERIQGRAICQK